MSTSKKSNEIPHCKFMYYLEKDLLQAKRKNSDARGKREKRVDYIDIDDAMKKAQPALSGYHLLYYNDRIFDGRDNPEEFFKEYYAQIDLEPESFSAVITPEQMVSCQPRKDICIGKTKKSDGNEGTDAGEACPQACVRWDIDCDDSTRNVFSSMLQFSIWEKQKKCERPICKTCGNNKNVVSKGLVEHTVHDIQCGSFPTVIVCNRRRFRCKIEGHGNGESLYLTEDLIPRYKKMSISQRLSKALASAHTNKWAKIPFLAEGYGLRTDIVRTLFSSMADDYTEDKSAADLHFAKQRNYEASKDFVRFFRTSFHSDLFYALCKTTAGQTGSPADHQIVDLYEREYVDQLAKFQQERETPLDHQLYFLQTMSEVRLSTFLYDFCEAIFRDNVAARYFALKIAVMIRLALHNFPCIDLNEPGFYNYPRDDSAWENFVKESDCGEIGEHNKLEDWSALLTELLTASSESVTLQFLFHTILDTLEEWLETLCDKSAREAMGPVYTSIQEAKECMLKQIQKEEMAMATAPLPYQCELEECFSIPDDNYYPDDLALEEITQELRKLQNHMETLYPEHTSEEYVQDVLHFNRVADPFVFKKQGNIFIRCKEKRKEVVGRGVSLCCLNCILESLTRVQGADHEFYDKPTYLNYDAEKLTEEQIINAGCPINLPICKMLSLE